MTDTTARYRILDDQLPDRPPLAVTDTYPAAVAAVQALHQQFRDQIAASGEGGAGALQSLTVEERTDDGKTVCRYLSSTNGHQ